MTRYWEYNSTIYQHDLWQSLTLNRATKMYRAASNPSMKARDLTSLSLTVSALYAVACKYSPRVSNAIWSKDLPHRSQIPTTLGMTVRESLYMFHSPDSSRSIFELCVPCAAKFCCMGSGAERSRCTAVMLGLIGGIRIKKKPEIQRVIHISGGILNMGQ